MSSTVIAFKLFPEFLYNLIVVDPFVNQPVRLLFLRSVSQFSLPAIWNTTVWPFELLGYGRFWKPVTEFELPSWLLIIIVAVT